MTSDSSRRVDRVEASGLRREDAGASEAAAARPSRRRVGGQGWGVRVGVYINRFNGLVCWGKSTETHGFYHNGVSG